MNEQIHQAVWVKSIDRCIKHIKDVRDESIRDYKGPYPEDAMPEYPDDGIRDSLCRVTPDFMKESSDDIISYLETLRDASRDMPPKEAQEYMLFSLRGELRDHMFGGVPIPTFNLLLGTLIELEEFYDQAATREAPHSGSMLRIEFFGPIEQYAELAEENMQALESMLEFHQTQTKVPEEERETELFRLAQRQLAEEKLISDSEQGMMSDEDVKACTERAEAIFEDMLEPYEHALPTQYCPELPLFIQRFALHHHKQASPAKNMPPAANDNDPSVHEKVVRDVSKVFLRHLEAPDDMYAMLAADTETKRMLGLDESVDVAQRF